MYSIEFEHEQTIETIDENPTILELALAHNIPHVHACGGQARCSTCRVAILKGLENITTRNEAEQKLADRRHFPPHIRLACQSRISGDVHLRRLVIDDQDIEEIKSYSEGGTGRETSLAILFSDIRNFTPTAEANLPYDVVHLLNRYFNRMGDAILNYDGYIDKYMGDGLMALFGLEGGTAENICTSAVKAALAMHEALQEVNQYVKSHLDLELTIGIGIHYGSVIAGEMGHTNKRQFTALGDNVNMAARIESITKKAKAGILVSDSVYKYSQGHVQKGRSFRTKLKGKHGEHRLHEILPQSGKVYTIRKAPVEQKASRPAAAPGAQSASTTATSAPTLQMVFSNKQEIAADTLAFRLQSVDAALNFQPGQWVKLRLPGVAESKIFSISSSPRDSHSILLATRLRASNYKKSLMELNSGTLVTITEPDGDFIMPESPAEPVVFLAGGIGITPLRSMLESYLPVTKSDMYLFYSNRDVAGIAFKANLDLWQSQYEHFHFIPALTGPADADWSGARGHIDAGLIQEHCPVFAQAQYYISGPESFVDAMVKIVQSLPVDAAHIHTESFAGYEKKPV